MLSFDAGSADRTLEMRVGETVEIRLAENPATGFRWRLAADGRPFCSVESVSPASGVARPGASRRHSWKIRAVAEGTCEVELVYRRPWEEGVAPARTVSLHIRVTQ